MKTISTNEAPDTDPICLAGQAEYVLAAIDEGHPARQALCVFLKASNERLGDSIEAVEAVDTLPTWEALVDPMEAASLDLFYVLALFETVHGEEDDPAMDAVGTLLRMAKNRVDEMTQAMIDKVHAARENEAPQDAPDSAITARANAEIDEYIDQLQGTREVFLNGAGSEDAGLVNMLDFAKRGFAMAKEVADVDDAWHRIVEAQSVLHGAAALAETSNGTAKGAIALLRKLLSDADYLMEKFDTSGVHYLESRQLTSKAPSQTEPRIVVTA